MREELKKQMQEQAPDEGAIIGYAIATHHRGKNLPDHFIAPPGTKVGLLFPVAGQSQGRREASTPSRSSATSRAA